VAAAVDGAAAGEASDIVDGGEDEAAFADDLAVADVVEVDVADADGADANDPPDDAVDPPYD
jgi:hypothetical protein